MRQTLTYIAVILLTLAASSCEERHPDNFGEICSVYFNNRVQGNVLCDTTDVTFVYETGDEMEIPVTVQLLGRAADYDRPVDITVSSDNAGEGTDYRLPDNAVLPAGEYSFTYNVTVINSQALQNMKKEIMLELHPNMHFSLSMTELEQTTDTVSTVTYRIMFSDMFTSAPAAWDENILGTFSQTKFDLVCKVLDIDPADFNDATVMTLPRQQYILDEMTRYIAAETEKMNNGEDFDRDIIDPETGGPVRFTE